MNPALLVQDVDSPRWYIKGAKVFGLNTQHSVHWWVGGRYHDWYIKGERLKWHMGIIWRANGTIY